MNDVSNVRTAKEARAKFITEAVPIMEHYLAIARGEPTKIKSAYGAESERGQRVIMDALIPMMQSAGDAQKIEAENTHDVIACLREGTITFLEAKTLMQMLSDKSDIEDVKLLLERVGQLTGGD